MPRTKKLIHAAAATLIVYALLTAVWMLPGWTNMTTTEAFLMAKHLAVVLIIVGMLYYQPRLGPWAALLWCAIVPFERYVMLLQELGNVFSGAASSMHGLDITRIVLLMISAAISGLIVFNMHYRQKPEAGAANDA